MKFNCNTSEMLEKMHYNLTVKLSECQITKDGELFLTQYTLQGYLSYCSIYKT